MNVPSRAERTLASGPFGTVEYAVRSTGRMEAREWLESESPKVMVSFGVLFQRLVEHGRIIDDTKFRKLDDEVWEFKRGSHRLLCYRLGNRCLLTHRIKKAGGRGLCPQGQIAHAHNVGAEHIAWEMQNRGRQQ
ncbi:MAG TPA: hypothetical protein VKU82_12965 [Planctomycetaceae bacterium]|nr:hypothetical protein [Planctomycetaceae bacterium]